jgi:enoyl-CoA hydratase/carnithine racemase
MSPRRAVKLKPTPDRSSLMDANATIESAPILLREDGEGIARLTLNRPKSRNALSDAMIAALSAELDRIATDASVKVVIMAGNGPAFCAGHDLKEMSARRADPDKGAAYFLDLMQRCSAMMRNMATGSNAAMPT